MNTIEQGSTYSDSPLFSKKASKGFIRTIDSLKSTSTSSSNSSRRGSFGNSDIAFPDDLVKSFNVFRQKVKENKKKQKTYSVYCTPSFPVTEEGDEKDETQEKRIPHVKIINDQEEFSSKISRNTRRNRQFDPANLRSRCRSLEGLPKVVEDKREDDEKKKKLQPLKMDRMKDKAEFGNEKERRTSQYSLTYQSNDSPIKEDAAENESKICEIKFESSTPRNKFIVDELDLGEEKRFKYIEQNDTYGVIEEEKNEQHEESNEHKILKPVMNKMQEEKEFIKKIVRSEMIDDEDNIRQNMDNNFTTVVESPINENEEIEGGDKYLSDEDDI